MSINMDFVSINETVVEAHGPGATFGEDTIDDYAIVIGDPDNVLIIVGTPPQLAGLRDQLAHALRLIDEAQSRPADDTNTFLGNG